jgi:hypothetical protein
MQESLRAGKHRLALFDPLTGKRGKWEGPVFAAGSAGEIAAHETIAEFNRLTCDDAEVTLCLGAFPWKSRQGASQVAPTEENA